MSSDFGTTNLLHPTRSRKGSGRELRRLSSSTARPVDLYAGNVTVAPARHLSKPSDAHETALALERAKSHLAEESGESTPDASSGATTPEEGDLKTTGAYAFAFDIDGVLIKGGEIIPEAIDAMKTLNGDNEYNIKVSVYVRHLNIFNEG
jgi:hypothetical protein